MNTYGKIQFATEIAFNNLINQAKSMGLEVEPVMGLMYLPSQEDARNFQVACKNILKSLGVDVDAPH